MSCNVTVTISFRGKIKKTEMWFTSTPHISAYPPPTTVRVFIHWHGWHWHVHTVDMVWSLLVQSVSSGVLVSASVLCGVHLNYSARAGLPTNFQHNQTLPLSKVRFLNSFTIHQSLELRKIHTFLNATEKPNSLDCEMRCHARIIWEAGLPRCKL